MQATDAEGNALDISADGTAQLPDGWPAELPPLEGARIISAASSTTPVSFNVTAGVDGEVAAVYEQIKAQLAAAGFTIDSDTLSDAGGGQVGTVSATGSELSASITVATSSNPELGSLVVSYSLREVTG